MPGEALTLQPFSARAAGPEGRDGIGLLGLDALNRSLQRLAACRVPLVVVEIRTGRGAGAHLLPLLAELGIAAELSADHLVLLSLGPSAARPGGEQRVAARVRALSAIAEPLRLAAVQVASDTIAGLDDLQALLALEAPLPRPQRQGAPVAFA